MAKVLVTGAAGQVGCRLVRQLLQAGYEVRGTILPDDPSGSRLDGVDLDIVSGNLLDPSFVESAIDGVDSVAHTANLTGRLRGMSEGEFFNNNVMSTFNVARAAGRCADRLERFVHVGSSSVYPNDSHILATCYDPVDELHPQRPMGTYPVSKQVGERIVEGVARLTGLRCSIVRPTGIVSGDGVFARFSVGMVAGVLRTGQAHPGSSLHMADGTELWHDLEDAAKDASRPCAISVEEGLPWVYQLVDARDVAHGIVCALESPAAVGEAFNLSAPAPIPMTQAAEVISRATGKALLEWKVPLRWIFMLSNVKARTLIGYRPKWGLEEMVADAALLRNGESDGMV